MANIYLVGVRGIPNRYGGFERLVEVLAPHLVSRGHEVTVFCEGTAAGGWRTDNWHGVRRQYVPVSASGALGTLQYDWRSFGAIPRGATALIFGYGTAIFQLRLRMRGIPHAVNMDGIEWQRQKWSAGARHWLRFNEKAAVRLSDFLIADHPEIQRYLLAEFGAMSEMIVYGVDLPDPDCQQPPDHPLLTELMGRPYFLAIARPEPENQVHVLLDAYDRAQSNADMVVVGNFDANEYGRHLQQKHPRVRFAGPVYDLRVLDALRRQSVLYLHGHSVGGTNPSLIEAMAAGALVAAHDNPFNRWVLNERGGVFFQDATDLALLMASPPSGEPRAQVIQAAQRTCKDRYLWRRILDAYESVANRLIERARK